MIVSDSLTPDSIRSIFGEIIPSNLSTIGTGGMTVSNPESVWRLQLGNVEPVVNPSIVAMLDLNI